MGAPGIPQNFSVQSGNQQILVSWSLTTGATSYDIQRSQDNVTFTSIATVSGVPLATSYLDSAVTLSTQYWYKVAAHNTDGYSPYTAALSAVPVPAGEMCLSQLRLAARQRADRVNSNFVTDSELNSYINQASFELYDLINTCYEDYFLAEPIQFVADGSTYSYPLPNGTLTFANANTGVVSVAPPFYKLMGVDLALNNATNAYVTINKFNFIDRNRFVYPNTASTIYGVFNLQYRVLGNNIQFIPTPSAGQAIRLWYIPRLVELVQDTDTSIMGVSGWMEYVIVRAAKFILDKEESDSSVLTQEIAFLKGRIEETASNRDEGQPDSISDTRSNGGWGRSGGFNGARGGWALALIPSLTKYNQTNGALAHSILSSQFSLGYIASIIAILYFLYLLNSKLSGRISFSWIGKFITFSSFISSFFNHILVIIQSRTQKQMVRINTTRIVTRMADKKTNRNRTFMNLIGNSMSRFIFAVYSKFTIATSVFTGDPKPTSFRFNYFVPKSFEFKHIKSLLNNINKVKRLF